MAPLRRACTALFLPVLLLCPVGSAWAQGPARPGWAALMEASRLMMTKPDDAEKRLREAEVEFKKAGDQQGQRQALSMLHAVCSNRWRRAMMEQKTAEARAHLDRAMGLAKEAGDPYLLLSSHLQYAEFFAATGEQAQADAHLQNARAVFAQVPEEDARMQCAMCRQFVYTLRRAQRLDEARTYADKMLAAAQAIGDVTEQVWGQILYAELHAQAQEKDAAEKRIRSVQEMIDQGKVPAWVLPQVFSRLAMAMRMLGREEDARAFQEKAQQLRGAANAPRNPPMAPAAGLPAAPGGFPGAARGGGFGGGPGLGGVARAGADPQVAALETRITAVRDGLARLKAQQGTAAQEKPPTPERLRRLASDTRALELALSRAWDDLGALLQERDTGRLGTTAQLLRGVREEMERLAGGVAALTGGAAPSTPAAKEPAVAVTSATAALGKRLCGEGEALLRKRRYADAEACFHTVMLLLPASERAKAGLARARAAGRK